MEKTDLSVISTPEAAVAATIHLKGLDHEEVWLVYLTSAGGFITSEMVSKGTLSQTSIDCRTILRQALLNNAAGIIILHNHPSGNPLPSPADIRFTQRLRKACSIMEIGLLDHIIVAEKGFYSFAEEKTYGKKLD